MSLSLNGGNNGNSFRWSATWPFHWFRAIRIAPIDGEKKWRPGTYLFNDENDAAFASKSVATSARSTSAYRPRYRVISSFSTWTPASRKEKLEWTYRFRSIQIQSQNSCSSNVEPSYSSRLLYSRNFFDFRKRDPGTEARTWHFVHSWLGLFTQVFLPRLCHTLLTRAVIFHDSKGS